MASLGLSRRLARPPGHVPEIQGRYRDIISLRPQQRPGPARLRARSSILARPGPALNDQGYYVGRVERNLYWVTDGDYHSAFLTTWDGVVLFDPPPTIGHNLQRAVAHTA